MCNTISSGVTWKWNFSIKSMAEKLPKYILIVDDDEIIQTNIREFLNKIGYICEIASDASEALKILHNQPFDLVISDIIMPGMDGIQFMQEAKRSFPHLDFVIMTGYGSDYSYAKIIEDGAADYMTKPFEMKELIARIGRIERERHILKELKQTNEQLEAALERANQMAIEAEYAYIELNQIFNTGADGICLIDRDFNILRINKAFSNFLGIREDEAVNKKCYEVFQEDLCQGPNCSLIRILGGESRVEYDIEKLRHDGLRIPCILTATPLRGPSGELFGIIEDLKDISYRRKAEEERIHREKLQGVLEMAGAVCHEVNQPMQSIYGYSQLLLMDISEDNPAYNNIKTIKEEIERMREITKKLMGITRYETKAYIEGRKIIDIDKATI